MLFEDEASVTDTHKLTKAICLAAAVLTIWLSFLALILYIFGSALSDYAAIINSAGKQRMLTQKAAYLTSLSLTDPDVKILLKNTLDELSKNQKNIANQLPTKGLQQYYIDQQLSQKLASYIATLNDLSTNVSRENTVLNIKQLLKDSEFILYELDLAVSQIQSSSDNAQNQLKVIQAAFMICSVGILIYLYFGVIAAPFKRNTKILQLKNKSILRFKKLFDNAHDGLLLFDSNWLVIHANQPALEMVTHEKIENDAIHKIWQDRVSAKLKTKVLSAIESNGEWQGEIITSNTQSPNVLVNIMCVTDDDELPFFCATLKDITLLKEKEEKLVNLALFDSLTGLANRANVIEAIDKTCRNSLENQSQCAVYFIDLDGFKLINDGFGHEVGDILLKAVAKRIQNQIQSTDVMARLGGDEFVILIQDVTDKKYLHTLAERVQKALDEPFTADGNACKITVSIGISLSSNEANNARDLLKQADIAMYHAKQKGKNQFHFFDHSMETFLQERISFEEDLYFGLNNNEFHQVFQPIVNIKTAEVVGCEVLLRWNSKKRGIVSPASFIPLAESLSLMLEIDKWVFAQSLSFLKKFPMCPHFSINLSPIHFVQPTLLREFLRSLNNLNPNLNVIFEVTETAIISDIEKSSKVIKEIKSYGHCVAIDDFGTGYTSLYYLKVLSFDYLKIDKSFIQDMLINDSSKAIVCAIINLARELNIKVIAEGVETLDAKNLLENFDCELAQGYLFARPVEEAEIHKYIK
ncbi:MAG: diguanylate cyclase (GGDEF)-like protein/PAS domain S-box-containing protein [Alphaproteobacteria bacterium]|jgi:diguanylate cyclase (GGDEF)-like protein/PAS domain S-box-containing protein